MKNSTWILLKVQLLRYFKINEIIHTTDRKKRAKGIALLFGIAIGLASISFYGGIIAISFEAMGMEEIIPAYIFSTAGIIALVFTIFRINGLLFVSKDYENIAAMPIKSKQILTARILNIYCSNFVFILLFSLPAVIIYFIATQPSVIVIIMVLVALIVLPLVPLLIGIAIGTLITLVTINGKKKTLFTTILYMVVFLGIFALSFNANNMTSTQITNIAKIITEKGVYANPILPFYVNAIETGNVLEFLLAAILTIGSFLLFISILGRFYTQINTRLMSKNTNRNYIMQTLKTSSALNALYKKEIKRYFSSTIYVMNTIFGFGIMLILTGAVIVLGPNKIEEILQIKGLVVALSIYLPIVLAAFGVISSPTTCSISLEGKNWWIPMSLPLKTKTILDSKILVSLTISIPVTFICSILFIIAIPFTIESMLVILIFPQIYNVFSAVLGITINRKHPNFTWDTDIVVVKQSAAVLIAMVIGMLSIALPIVLASVLNSFSKNAIFSIVGIGIAAVTFILYKMNNKADLRLLEES